MKATTLPLGARRLGALEVRSRRTGVLRLTRAAARRIWRRPRSIGTVLSARDIVASTSASD